jgi:Abortive infection C-terminus
MILDELKTDFEKAQGLQNLLISQATGGLGSFNNYILLRKYFIDKTEYSGVIPSFVRTNRDLDQFWQFIKFKYKHYAERKDFIWTEFSPLMDLLEGRNNKPSDTTISDGLKSFDEDGINAIWAKALERRKSDPEGAITMARTLMESVCKHILDSSNVVYDKDKTELPDLYKLTSKELNIAPSQHTEEVFKQILGGVASIVNGLGALRNRLGDAHGKGKAQIRPAQRHAQLAVNLAGATALFLIETWQFKNNNG